MHAGKSQKMRNQLSGWRVLTAGQWVIEGGFQGPPGKLGLQQIKGRGLIAGTGVAGLGGRHGGAAVEGEDRFTLTPDTPMSGCRVLT